MNLTKSIDPPVNHRPPVVLPPGKSIDPTGPQRPTGPIGGNDNGANHHPAQSGSGGANTELTINIKYNPTLITQTETILSGPLVPININSFNI